MHHAARAGNSTAIQFILEAEKEAKVNIDAQSIGGETPLMKAAEHGSVDNFNMLLKAGCNPFLKDIHGKRADDYAEINHPEQNVHMVLREYMAEIEGGDVQMAD